jgi:hypothetical protein
MESQQRIHNLTTHMYGEIQKLFDLWLFNTDDDDLDYDDLEHFQEEYDNFVEKIFSDKYAPIDKKDFKHDFCWFDVLKIIKTYYLDIEQFDDYDDEEIVWKVFCYVCARQACDDITEQRKYKLIIKTPQEKFIKACNTQIKNIVEEDDTEFKKKSKLLKKVSIQYFEYLKKFDIENANKNLQLINLLFQSKMKEFEKEPEQKYIDVCKMCKKKYEFVLAFKQEAIKIKDL